MCGSNSESPSPPNTNWRPLGQPRRPISKSGASAMARASSNSTSRKQPPTPSPTHPDAQSTHKRGHSGLFVDDDSPEPSANWGDESRKKQRVGGAMGSSGDARDGGEDSDDGGTVCGDEDRVGLSRLNGGGGLSGPVCEAIWPATCGTAGCPKCGDDDDLDMKSEDGDALPPSALRAKVSGPGHTLRKLAIDHIRKVNFVAGRRRGEGAQNGGHRGTALREPELEVERIRKQFRTHHKEGKAITAEILLRLANGPLLLKPELRDMTEDIGVHMDFMLKRYEEATATKKKAKPKLVKIEFPKSERELRQLVGRGPAEMERPWLSSVAIEHRAVKYLWRVYDHASQGVIRDQDIGMVAGGSAFLNSPEERKNYLGLHIKWNNKQAGPILSFCDDLEYLHDEPRLLKHFVNRAASKKPADTVWIPQVSVNARIEEARPMLNALDELDHYLPDERLNRSRFEKEWFLLYQVHPEEIVWNWNSKHIERWMEAHNCFGNIKKWEEAIAMPVYEVHEAARLEGKSAKARRAAVNKFLQTTDMKYAALIEKDKKGNKSRS